jgi:hypothetical protein
MFDQYDEAELLELIEDKLDPLAAQRLRDRLAADPRVLALIERMREDRALLRSAVDPALPGDLLAELEPILARPMLMPETPAPRRRRPRVMAVAAAVALTALAGVWATVIALFWPVGPGANQGAARDTALPAMAASEAGPPVGSSAPGEAGEAWPPAGTVVHHRAPLNAVSGELRRGSGPAEIVAGNRSGEPLLLAADFMLVVSADDAALVEQTFRRVLSDFGTDAALVRNFSYEEAAKLEEALRLAEGRRSAADTADAGPVVAGAEGGPAGEAPRARNGRRRPPFPRASQRPEARLSASQLLLGSEALAPSFERQLDFSEQGAAYTVSVPAARLTQVLARLELEEGCKTALRIRAGDVAEDPTDELRWLRQYPLVREAAAALEIEGRGAVILLPVAVEER